MAAPIGDAWLLTQGLIEQALDTRDRHDYVSSNRLRDFGLWKGGDTLPASDPLGRMLPAPQTDALFAPTADGGLGIPPERALIRAGVTAVGHLYHRSAEALLTGEDGVLITFDAAVRTHPRLRASVANRKAWQRVTEAVEGLCYPLTTPERAASRAADVEQPSVVATSARDMRRRSGSNWSTVSLEMRDMRQP